MRIKREDNKKSFFLKKGSDALLEKMIFIMQ